MPNLILDLISTFNHRTIERARSYLHNQGVISLKINDGKQQLSGKVISSTKDVYNVHIDLYLEKESGKPAIDGFCSCPVTYNCKHVCALLLKAEEKYGYHAINSLLQTSSNTKQGKAKRQNKSINDVISMMKHIPVKLEDFGIVTPSTLDYKQPPQKTTGDAIRNNWLQQLKSITEQESKTLAAPKTNAPTSSCLVYLLKTRKNGSVFIHLNTCRYLKKGGIGKPTPYTVTHNKIHNNDWLAWIGEKDQQIIKTIFTKRPLIRSFDTIGIKGSEGSDILSQIIDTGRCLLGEEAKKNIKPGKAIKGVLRWIITEKGRQTAALLEADCSHKLKLIPTDPPYYLKVFDDYALCGAIHDLPDAALLTTLLQAPPLDNSGVEKTRRALLDLLETSSYTGIKLPEKINSSIVYPVPIIILSSLPYKKIPSGKKRKSPLNLLGNDNTKTVIATAHILFSYNGIRVNNNDCSISLHPNNDKQTIIPRQTRHEVEYMQQLPPFLKPASSRLQSPVENTHNNYLIADITDINYQRNWLHFVTKIVPNLEEQGWIIEINDNFPFKFEAIPDKDWQARVEDNGNNWFSLKLGITIDGEILDILPLLARQINQLPSPSELKKLNKDASITVALSSTKYINIPAGRLSLILSTLLDLFGKKPREEYKLQNHHAQPWEELYESLGLPWTGSEKLLELSQKLKSFKRIKKVNPTKDLQADLRPYQQQGLSWLQFLREHGLNGILADDMGLGKTLQALAHLQLEKQRLGKSHAPSLVACPTSLIYNWYHEAKRYTPNINTHIHHGAQRDYNNIEKADLVLTSYGIVQRDFEELKKHHFHYLILDEAQAIKNPHAKAGKAIRCLQAKHKLCITGTPMENHLGELWSLFDFLMPGFLGSSEQFTRHFRTPIEKRGEDEVLKKLQKRISPFMLRRKKDLIAKELPPKTETIRTTVLEGKQRDLYETVRASMEAKVRSEVAKKGLARSQIFILDALLKMRQICCDPSLAKVEQAKEVEESAKLDLLMSLVEPMISEGRKILIFSQFTSMLSLIENRLQKTGIAWVKLTGKTHDRNKSITSFQSNEVPVFLISIKAGGTGLNLTAADTIIHYDPWWNPAVEDQASDRAHRIGQNKPVFVYKLITEGTVEEKIQELKEKKRAIANAIYADGKTNKTNTITADDLNVLFEPVTND